MPPSFSQQRLPNRDNEMEALKVIYGGSIRMFWLSICSMWQSWRLNATMLSIEIVVQYTDIALPAQRYLSLPVLEIFTAFHS
jgi:hypothetical protein